jgi:hypothetical protein
MTTDCVPWSGAIWKGTGYGYFRDGGTTRLAHRAAYESVKGLIPEGLVIDHLCRIPACVNPDHLEAVTVRENILRGVGITAQNVKKTSCPQGHPYDRENTYVRGRRRTCRTCHRAHQLAYTARKASR